MSNSHWYHFFFHDDFGVIRSKINFFSGGKVCLVVASGGGHVPLLPPPLGPALNNVGGDKVRCIFYSDAYTCVKFHENADNSFKVIQ